MPFKKLVIVFLSVLFQNSIPVFVYGSEMVKTDEKTPPKKQTRMDNVESIETVFALRPTYNLQSNWLRITPRNEQGKILNYQPNVLGSAGGMIKIKNIVVSYKHKIPTSESSNELYGKTDYRNIDLNIQSRIVGYNINYQNYRGFYLNPTQNFESVTTQVLDTIIKRPDIQFYSLGLKLHFVFTHSFSLNAAFAQNERQKKSAGSFMIMIGNRFTQYRMDSTLITADQSMHYSRLSRIDRGSFNTTNIAFGCGYSFIKGNFSYTPIILPGIGLQLQSYDLDHIGRFGLRLPYYLSFKNALGYNGKTLFTRLIGAVELDNTPFRDSRITMYYLYTEFSLGIRF